MKSFLQMLTALVLQLIQCVVVLPRKMALADEKGFKVKGSGGGGSNQQEVIDLEGGGGGGGDKKADTPVDDPSDPDVYVTKKYHDAMGTAHKFLTVFLDKCSSKGKNEDVDYRPLFENFVQDLLTTVNTPEWPAAELLLSFLGRVLVDKFRERSTEMALRISSLEYLGVIASKLRKDAVQSKTKVSRRRKNQSSVFRR